GNYQGPVEIPIDIGSYTCETGLDRCGTFFHVLQGPTDVAEFMKLQGGRILTPLWLFGTNGTVEGTTCMSQTDCQTLKASNGDKGCKTKQNCCCSTDDCADYNNSSFSMPLLTSLMMMLAIVMMKH
ncbi:hypothetical protein PMAYCL1PPCAC_04655, partial [Pristionchus mayeri]